MKTISSEKKCILAIITEDSTLCIYEENRFYPFKKEF